MAWIIKVLTPEDKIDCWYVKSIKRDQKHFTAISQITGAKQYKNKTSFDDFLSHLDECKVSYELIEVAT